jgi:hypothetical protein
MSKRSRFLLFFFLPILASFLYPPSTLIDTVGVLIVVLILFIGLGILLLQGRSLALTFSIFIQGINAIARLMMLFPNSFSKTGEVDVISLITCLAGLALSIWLLFRLDKSDVRVTMTR